MNLRWHAGVYHCIGVNVRALDLQLTVAKSELLITSPPHSVAFVASSLQT
jgi:hypothetical protein